MHTPSVEEDGVCHGEDRTGLPPPLDAALQPSCGKRMLSTPAHGQTRTAGWRVAEQLLAALGYHRRRSKRHSSREETQTYSRNTSVFGCTMPTNIQAKFSLRRNITWRRRILFAPVPLRNRRVRN
jgi:hypothetical protein